jgi:hypothetical protein
VSDPVAEFHRPAAAAARAGHRLHRVGPMTYVNMPRPTPRIARLTDPKSGTL